MAYLCKKIKLQAALLSLILLGQISTAAGQSFLVSCITSMDMA